MADSHPFANAGLGMFGSAERSYAGSAMRPSSPDKNKPDLLGILGTMLGNYLNKPKEEYSIAGAAPAPVSDTNLPAISATPAGVAPPGINPIAPAGMGISFNRQPTGLNTFGNTTLGQQQTGSASYNPVTMQVWGNQQ